ncbi:exodeoxyribonuclease VII small subunit [Parasutterella muris]|jgi:exodeoxyribonuclease VII, small subunit|uniref:exodeoxyribonuclease VII small subunit n=1 Tax=Parasutterella muris TaxID=2565572 RepID=UPI001F02C435|nr:exodeoxyribonuclease VII small subunit [Parasutterella muris]
MSKQNSANASDDDIKEMSFEAALKELESLSEKMSQGGLSLQESVEAYSRGAKLKQHCSQLLKAAEEKIRVIDAAMKEDDIEELDDDGLF